MKIPISWKLRLAARNQHFPWGRWPSSGIHLKFWFCYGLFDPEDMKIGSNLGFIALPVHATQSDFEWKKSKTHSFRALKWLYLISILHFHRQIFVTSTLSFSLSKFSRSSSPRLTSSRSESKFSWRHLKQHVAGRDTAKMVPFSI